MTNSPSQVKLQNGSFVYGPGDVKYTDLDNNKEINGGLQTLSDHGDLVVIGNTTPRYRIVSGLAAAGKDLTLIYFSRVLEKRIYGVQAV